MKSIRKIIQIDEEKCDGCGLCVPSCAEGAIQVVDGKARLVAEKYCDGLGACLGECPKGALQVVDAEVDAFDEEAAKEHVRKTKEGAAAHPHGPAAVMHTAREHGPVCTWPEQSRRWPCGCPSTLMQTFAPHPADRLREGQHSGRAGPLPASRP